MAEKRKPACSVVIPAYNCEGYIEGCLRSVQAQTIPDVEIIVIDDGSTDCTAERVQAMAAQDERITLLVNEKNRGVAETRNRGVRMAHADWVAFLDSDDCWLPDKLEKQFALQEKTGAEFLYTGAVCMSSAGKLLSRRFTPPRTRTYRELLRGNEIVCSTVLTKRELLLEHPMAHSDLHEDYICWLRILADGITAHGLPEPLICYRLAENSKSRNKLKSAKMTWQSYAYLGIPFCKRCGCFWGYAVHSVRRYFL